MPSIMITSANRGLGLEFVRQYAADGWTIFAACRNPDAADDLHELTRSGSITVLPIDVTDLSSVRHAAGGLHGGSNDVLLHSAGIIGKPGQRTGHIDYESWEQVLNVNTMGPLRVTEAFVEHVARSERKLIVTITSGLGSLTDNTSGGSIPYRSSKAAVNMAMRPAHSVRERRSPQESDRHIRIGPFRKVLSLRWPRICMVSLPPRRPGVSFAR